MNDQKPESPPALAQDQPFPRRIALTLNDLVPFTSQDNALYQASDLYQELCQPWPPDSMMWNPTFVDFLPDLDPILRSWFLEMPTWQDEPITAIELYVDGSSFLNRYETHEVCAAWGFIVIFHCMSNEQYQHKFYAATTHQLSHGNMPAASFTGCGEISHDPASAEAAGMLAAMSWVAQATWRCPYIIHYDNCTIGNWASGQAQWHPTWDQDQLATNISALRHCFEVTQKQVSYAHVKAHEGHPINEAVDALAKATARGIIPNMPIPPWVSNTMMNRHFRYTWMNLANSAEIPKPAALRGHFRAEGPFHDRKIDVTWNHPEAQMQSDEVDIALTTVTANVLTLEPGPKAMQFKGLMQLGRIATLQA